MYSPIPLSHNSRDASTTFITGAGVRDDCG
jgi:hypothetical protein